MSLPLNIDWQQILLHLFNFVILYAILYFLLYKPVKDFMEKRTAYYKKLDDEAKANLIASEKAKEEYTRKIASAEEEIFNKKEKACKDMEEANAIRIKQTQKEREKIITDARCTLEKERMKMLTEAGSEIADMVVAATEKLVLQSSTRESYEQFLSSIERGGEHE